MNRRQQRLNKLANLYLTDAGIISFAATSIIQDIKDFGKMILPDDAISTPSAEAPKSQLHGQNADAEAFNVSSATSYNTKSENLFKKYEQEIKNTLQTTADWKSPEFAQAVYQWQKNNGITGKWVDGKLGPVTMSAITKNNPALKEQYTTTSMTPWTTDGNVKLRLTGYWPFTAHEDEKKMEGGIFDRKMPDKYKNDPSSPQYQAHVLHTVEQYFEDPIKHPFVSLSGDDAIWPYGQELIIPWNGKSILGKVVDTGSHFRGAGKIYRTEGYEPIDVCVESSQTKVPTHVTAQVVGGAPIKATQPVVAELVSKRIKNAKINARKIILGGIK